MMLTVAYFCEDTENFNDWSASTGTTVENVDDDLKHIDQPLPARHFLRDIRVESMPVAQEAEAFDTTHQ